MYMPEPKLSETEGRAWGGGSHRDMERWLWDSSAWVQMPAPSAPGCVILAKSLALSGPSFPLMSKGNYYQLFRSVGGERGGEWLPRSMGASSWQMNKFYSQEW